MADLALRPASDFSSDTLAAAFTRAYEGYLVPVNMTPEAFAAHMRTNDIALERSVVAQASDGALVGIACLGVRDARGWVGGVGVAPELRGQGVGKALMTALIGQAREARLRAVLLEVLGQNAVARQLYERLGFRIVRRLDIFTGTVSLPAGLAPVGDGQTTRAIVAVPVAQALASYAGYHSVQAPWQREPATLTYLGDRLQALALLRGGAAQAYLIYTASGANHANIMLCDLGSRSATAEGRSTDGCTLLTHLLAAQPDAPLRAVNIPAGDLLGDTLRALGCPVVMTQHEMALDLDLD
jgi:ribosomal protein S18 acetylase RimI-like enzyme